MRRLVATFKTRVPAEGVQHERGEVVAEETENEIERRVERGGRREVLRTEGGDFGRGGVEEKGERVEAGGVEARA